MTASLARTRRESRAVRVEAVDMIVECGVGSMRAKRPSGANENSPAVDMTKLRRVITVEKESRRATSARRDVALSLGSEFERRAQDELTRVNDAYDGRVTGGIHRDRLQTTTLEDVTHIQLRAHSDAVVSQSETIG